MEHSGSRFSRMLVLVAWGALLVPGGAFGAGNIGGFIGAKSFNEDDWAPVDVQGEIGVRFDYQGASWPVAIAVDGFVSAAEEDGVLEDTPAAGTQSRTWLGVSAELNVGVRRIWEASDTMRPFVGGGLALIWAGLEGQRSGTATIDDTDTGVGAWVSAGMYWTIARHLNLGFDVRLSGADVTLFGKERQAGGFHSGFIIGYHWD